MTATCPVCNSEIELVRYGFGWIGKCRCSEFVNFSDEEIKEYAPHDELGQPVPVNAA
jgi:hypothetical protein